MATNIALTELPDPYERTITATPVTATFTFADVVNGNEFRNTGREFVVVQNNDAGAQTVTVTSQPHSRTGRLGHITAASIPAAAYRVFQVFPPDGWATGGVTLISASDADVRFAVLRGQLQGIG